MTADSRDVALRCAVSFAMNCDADQDTRARVAELYQEFLGLLNRPAENQGALYEILADIRGRLDQFDTKVDAIMTAQDDIDAGTAALTALTGDIAGNVAQLQSDVAAIAAALAAVPVGVDTAALDAAVAAAQGTAASLDSAVSAVTSTTAPAAPAAPSDPPSDPAAGA